MNIKQTEKTGYGLNYFGIAAGLLLYLAALTTHADNFQVVSQYAPSYSPSISAGGNSSGMVFTPDGRYVAFASTAKNLALTSNHTAFSAQFWPCFNLYLRDRTNGTTTLVSINSTGTGVANADAVPRGISTNGQFVLFESFATNLVTNTTSGKGDIYLRDVINGTTLLVSLNTNGVGGNAVSQDSVMTPNGRFVAFSSLASDLVINDTNGIFDVFIRDTVADTTQLISVGASLAPGATFASESKIPLLTPDGRFVLYYSTATNIVLGVPTAGELYLYDTLSNISTWVSSGTQGLFATNAISFNSALSDDGNFVAYEASSMAYPSPANGFILQYDVQTGLTETVSTNAFVQPFLLPENMASLDMTPDGRFIAYVGNPGPVGSSEGFNFTNAVFVWDADTGSNTLASVNLSNGVSPTAESDYPVLSTNGQYVAFVSSDTNLTTNILNGAYHIFRRDLIAGVTQLMDMDTNGAGAGVTPDMAAVMSPDGSLVAYQSTNAMIVPNDRNRDFDVFLFNSSTQATELVSLRDSTLPSLTPDGSSGLTAYAVNGNGRYVAFASAADDLTAGNNSGSWNVFVRDLLNGTNALVSVATNALAGIGNSFEPAISSDGRFVAFSSYSSNLAVGDKNNSQDVFLRDLQAGTTTLVSVGQDGVSFGSSNSWQPIISTNGRYVLFHSMAQNLASGTVGTGVENIFLRDLQSNLTYALGAASLSPTLNAADMTPDGHYVAFVGKRSTSGSAYVFVWNTQTASLIYSNLTTTSYGVSISRDGQKVVSWGSALTVANLASNTIRPVVTGGFSLNGGARFSANGNLIAYAMEPSSGAYNAYNVYLYNYLTGSNTLISHAYNSRNTASGFSDSPVISADGRFVVYRSIATNLLAGITSGMGNLFVYDGSTGVNSLLTQNVLQTGAADSFSRTPIFSSDGKTLIFQSWSSDLTSSGDFNSGADLFEYGFPYLQIMPPVSALEGPVFTWPAAPGQTYQVQYTGNLAPSSWQNLAGTLAVTGNLATLSNTLPIAGPEFFRLVIQ